MTNEPKNAKKRKTLNTHAYDIQKEDDHEVTVMLTHTAAPAAATRGRGWIFSLLGSR